MEMGDSCSRQLSKQTSHCQDMKTTEELARGLTSWG